MKTKNTIEISIKIPTVNPTVQNKIITEWMGALDFKEVDFDNNKISEITLESNWLLFILKLNQNLYESLCIPIFHSPTIISLTRDKAHANQCTALIEISRPTRFKSQILKVILNFSNALAGWISVGRFPTQENRLHAFDIIQKFISGVSSEFNNTAKSTYQILRIAHHKKIPFFELTAGVYQLGWGVNSKVIDRSTTENDSAIGMRLARNKYWTSDILQNAGLPSPKHFLVKSLDAATSAASVLGFPVVVKPVDRERGEGVAVDVDKESLKEAFENAAKISPSRLVLVEQQVHGVCHRIFISQNKVLYAVKRLPIGVYGDGINSIGELVNKVNFDHESKPPWKSSTKIQLDEMAKNTLHRHNLSENFIPSNGQFVPLRSIETTAWGGVFEEVTQTIHPENMRIALVAAKIFNLNVSGIDMISPDITQPWYSNGAIINEVNFAPLLGGSDISRSYLDQYITQLVPRQGRIPIVVFVGGEAAMVAAKDFLKDKNSSGHEMVLTSAILTLNPNGEELMMPLQGLNARINALLMHKTTHALIIVIQTNEIVSSPLDIDSIDEIFEIDKNIADHSDKFKYLNDRDYNSLIGILKYLQN